MSETKKPIDDERKEQLNRQAQTANISLEAAKLDSIAQIYPVEIREDFLWLGAYLRDRCNRNLDVLVHQVREKGFTAVKTTFSKILRGKWNTDAEGKPTAPVMAVRNFNQMVQALRSEAQHIWQNGRTPFIKTGTYQAIDDYITTKRAPETICKFGLILGPTGGQKTASTKFYCFLNNSGKCVHLEAPEKPTMGRFVRELGTAYGIPEKINGEKLRMRIKENVKAHNTIIVDNVQRLHKPGLGWNQEIFSYLQKLQDDTGCTIIMVSIPSFESLMTAGEESDYFEQFIGRVGGDNKILRLDDYAPRQDVLDIAEAFGLKDADRYLPELEKLSRSPGRIRILFTALQDAKRAADANEKPLTIRYVREATGKVVSEEVAS